MKQDGTVAARYDYDVWGRLLSITDGNGNTRSSAMNHIGNINPMRYRGYYYDRDLGLYYLQSRFYDAGTGRFINADGYVSTGQGLLSQNMFAYCLNNPVIFSDPCGTCCDCENYILSIAYVMRISPDEVRKHVNFKCPLTKKSMHDTGKPQVYEYTEMKICTDGGKNSYGSKSHQSGTSYSIKGDYMEPTQVRYVVAPKDYDGVNNGDFAIVIDCDTGEYVYAIVGDRGPESQYFCEVSLSVAWDLGYSSASGTSGPEGNFKTIVYPGTARGWNSLQELISTMW